MFLREVVPLFFPDVELVLDPLWSEMSSLDVSCSSAGAPFTPRRLQLPTGFFFNFEEENKKKGESRSGVHDS